MADVIKFKGEFDTSQMIGAIKQMRAELAKSGNSSLFGNLDKEISKIESLGNTIQAQMSKGFASSREFKAFESNIEKLELEVQKIGKTFGDVSLDNLSNQLKKVDSQTATIAANAKKAVDEFKKAFNADMGNVGKNAKEMNRQVALMVESGKSYADIEKKVVSLYDEKIQKAKELANIEKQAILDAKNSQTVSTAGLDRNSLYKSNGQGRRGSALTDGQFAQVSAIWEASIKNFPTASKALTNFREELKKLNIVRRDNTSLNNAFRQSYAEYQSTLQASSGAIKAHESALKNAQKTENELIAEKSRYIASLKSEEIACNATIKTVNEAAAAEARGAQEKQKYTQASNTESAAISKVKDGLNQEVNSLRQGAAATGEAVQSTQNLNNSLDMLKSRITYLFSIGNAFYQIKKALTDTLNDVKNIDKAFASIAMVTEKTISGLWEHYGEYAEMAQKLGQSTESAIKASALFYQQGLKDVEVMQLTEDTMRLATLAGLDFEKATSQMTAALRGFHMEMDQGAHITDVYSELAAHAAADVNGIAYAMSKTASIANNAGMSFENTAAFLTQMIETTQEAPENIGTAMKTIIARFTELKKNIAGTADSEFDDLEYNKVDKALKSVGISIKDASGQFRNLDDVFLELSQKWDTLDRNSQRYIATIAAGSRQQSRFIAMMEDYDRVMELVTVTQESQGRSQKQFEKNADSIQFKIQQLKTAWEQFRLSLANSDFFKKIIDMLTKFVDTLNNMDFKQLLTVGVIGTTLGKLVITNFVDTLRSSTGAIQTAWKQAMGQPIKDMFSAAKSKRAVGELLSNKTGFIAGADNVLGRKFDMGLGLDEQINKTDLLRVATQEYVRQLEYIEQLKQKGAAANAQQIAQAQQQSEDLLKQANLVREQLGYEQQITRENAIQINQGLQENELKNGARFGTSATGKALKGALGSGATAGITAGLMAAISGADFSTVLKTAGTSALMAAIPSILQAVMPLIISFLSGPAGIITLVAVAAVGAITSIVSSIKKAESAELDRLAKVSKANEELRKKNEELIVSYHKAQDENEKFIESVKAVRQYQNKGILTPTETNKFNEAVDYLNENYEGVLDYNEINDHYTIVETKLDTIIEELAGDEQGARTEFYQNESKQQNNLTDRIFKTQEYVLGLQMLSAGGMKNPLSGFYENLGKLNTIYGEELNLDEIFGISGLENTLLTDDVKNLESLLEELNMTGDDLVNKVPDLNKKLGQLNKTEQLRINNTYAQQALEMQKWESTAAAIAAYGVGTGNIKGRAGSWAANNEAASEIDYFQKIQSGQLNLLYGANADKAKQAFAQLGYGAGKEKGFADLFSSGTNLVEWDKLSNELQAALESLGVNKAQWNGKGWGAGAVRADRKQSAMAAYWLYQALNAQAVQDTDFLSSDIQDNLGSNKEVFEKISKIFEDYTDKTFTDYAEELNDFINEQDNEVVKEKLRDFMNNSDDSFYKKWSDSIAALGEIGLDQSILKEIDYAGVQQLQASIGDFSESQLKLFAKHFNEQLDGADSNVLNILSEIDLSHLADIGAEDAKEYIDQLTEATGDAEEAQRLYNNYIKYVRRLTGATNYYGADSVEILRNTSKDQISGLAKTYEDVGKAYTMQASNGKIDQKTYKTLLDAGLEEYITETANGYELLTDKIEEMWANSAMASKNHIDSLIESQTDAIVYAEGFRSSLDKNIKKYKELSDQGKDTSSALKKLTDEEAAFVEVVAGAGYSSMKEYIAALKEGKVALDALSAEVYFDALVSISEAFSEAKDKVNELKDKIEDLTKSVNQAKESLDEANQKLYEAYHGTELFKSSLDGLINYQTKLKGINNSIEDIKDSLEDVATAEEATTLFSNLSGNYDSKVANLSAQNVVINDALKNLRETLEGNYSEYVHFIGDELNVDFAYLAMDANDNLRKALEEEVQQYQKYQDTLRQNNKDIKAINKEREQIEKDALKKFTDIQKDVIDVLKATAQEEVNITKDKYNAMKEADDDYISALEEAIQKQQKLRDRENEMDELATKEKKLSLMRRDTSGANAKDILSLEKDVQDAREKLLDDSVQDIVDNLKELYKTQAEAREQELEYMEAVTENAQYFNEWAQNIVSSWESVDDMKSWFLSNDSSVEDMTVEQAELYIQDIEDKWKDLITYQGLEVANFQTNTDEINTQMTELYNNTSENISNLGTFTQETYQKAADEAIKAAEKAQESAQESYDDAVKKLQEAQQELSAQEATAINQHEGAMATMVEASKSALDEVSSYAARTLLEWSGEDINDTTAIKTWAKKMGMMDSNGALAPGLYDALAQKGADMSGFTKQAAKQAKSYDGGLVDYDYMLSTKGGTIKIGSGKSTAETADASAKAMAEVLGYSDANSAYAVRAKSTGVGRQSSDNGFIGPVLSGDAYLNGLTNDGASSIIKRAGDIMSGISSFNYTDPEPKSVYTPTNVTANTTVNIDNINSESDLENMLDRIKGTITEAAQKAGNMVTKSKK